jgi:cardiolipin synthase
MAAGAIRPPPRPAGTGRQRAGKANPLTFEYSYILIPLHLGFATWAALHALLNKADTYAAAGWIAFIIIFPLAGPLLYLLFGINRIRRKAKRQAGSASERYTARLDRAGPHPDVANLPSDPLQRVGARIMGVAAVGGNSIRCLRDGEQAFPAMLAAIRAAEHEVLLSTYIFDADDTGKSFVTALADAQTRGATVRVLVDDFGRRYSFPTIVRALRRAGIEHARFMPLRLIPPSLSINLRNHRKILVVDRQTAFAGGMNIGDRQLARGDSRHRASDLHFEFRGPVLGALRDAFADDWHYSGRGPIAPVEGDIEPVGESLCRVVTDGPDGDFDHLALVINGAISAARSRIRIMTPYFVPDRKLVAALQSAALRGVDVRLIVPMKNNWPLVGWATQHLLAELLQAGIRVFLRKPPFAHSKCLLIDEHYALVGSTNLDARSLRLNFEIGIEVFSTATNHTLAAVCREAEDESVEMTAERYGQRSMPRRVRDATAALFSPYL